MDMKHAEAVRAVLAEKLGVDVPLKDLRAIYDDVVNNEFQQVREYGGKRVTFFPAGRGFASAAVGAVDLPNEEGETAADFEEDE